MHRRHSIWVGLLVVLASPAWAADGAPVVWYRASEECPSGPDFLGKLGGRAAGARLAEAGDHMDFVVTLVATQGETLGRLERQTQSGTVAIRELRDASCVRVADALALSLALALEPNRRAAETQDPAENSPPPEPAPPADPAPAPAAASAQSVTPALSPALPADTVGDSTAQPPLAESGRRWAGLQGGTLLGVSHDPLVRAALFVESGGVLATLLPRLSLRVAALGAIGSSSTDVGPIRRWLLGGRVEACPWWLGGSALKVSPCAAFELGASGASATRSNGGEDVNVWAAPAVALRGTLTPLSRFRLEAEAGALLPLFRDDLYAGSQALYQAEIIAFQGSLGLSFGLP